MLVDLIPRDRKIRNILEVGCAEGRVLKVIVDQFGIPCSVGTDITPLFITTAARSFPDTFFYLSDVEKIPHRTKSFDVVICSDVLEHIPDLDKFLDELTRVGHATIFKIPIEKCWLNTFRTICEHDSDKGLTHSEGHFHLFSFRSAIQLLRQHGFRIQSINLICPPLDIQYASLPTSDWNRHPSIIAQNFFNKVLPQLCVPALVGPYLCSAIMNESGLLIMIRGLLVSMLVRMLEQ
ncbi:MAG: class I SAM-dependent methyltransferase [Planctomycetota bacterium]